MRILLSGGGTGGHVYPAIAIADQIKSQNPNHEILFIGARGKMEVKLVREAGYPMAQIWMDGFARWRILKNLLLPLKVMYSVWKTKRIFKYFNPDIVIGTGGYVSAPVISVASKMGIPVVIQEQNTVLGLTNKSFLKNASKVFVTTKELFDAINKKYDNAELCGNPIRDEILKSKISKKKAIEHFELDPKKKCLLVIGGSLGAKTINEVILKNIDTLINSDIQIVWQTGGYYYNKVIKKIKNKTKTIKAYPFLKDIKIAYATADLVIARAGALTIAELAYKKKPVIFIPSPNVTNDHQTKNTIPLIEKEAAYMIRDKNVKNELVNTILKLLNDSKELKKLSKNIATFAHPEATKKLTDLALKIPRDISLMSNSQLLKRFKYVYFIGIGGIGMSALAKWFAIHKIRVFGYDRSPSSIINDLKQMGISISFEDKIRFMPKEIAENIRESLIIYTPAILEDSEILTHLKEKEYTIFKRADILSKIISNNYTIAIAGTHGKTTTSALILHILYSCNINILGFIGGIVKKYNSNLIFKNLNSPNAIAIVEADEYDKSFLKLQSNIGIITSVDPDHLDFYKTKKELKQAYKKFYSSLPDNGRLIIQDNAYNELFTVKEKDSESHIIKYSINEGDIKAENIEFYDKYVQFDYIRPDRQIKAIKLPIQGYHNIENTLAAITACTLLGIKSDMITKAISTFPGISRRFEYIVDQENFIFINDYAHHPAEIDQLLKSLKDMYPMKEITIIFQPHLYSRTKHFAKEFAESLNKANKVYLLPIYPAREAPIRNVTSKIIYTKIKNKNKLMCEKEDVVKKIIKESPQLLVTIGAGDIDDLVNPIKEAMVDTLR